MSTATSAKPSPGRTSSRRDTEVGIVRPCYGLEKVSYGLPHRRYHYRRVYGLPLHRLERRGTFFRFTPVVLNRSVPLLHTFNQLPVGRHRFIVSFENELPRYLDGPAHWQMRYGLRRLRSKDCRAILALSDTAMHLARRRFVSMGEHDIAARLRLFRGGVTAGEVNPARSTRGPLRVLFVGADGFRKGLAATFRAVAALRRAGVEIELTVVSALVQPTYVFGELTPDRDGWRAQLERESWVRWHATLPNTQVRRLMTAHDVLAFPTFDETLGWVIIEAALEGTAAITTNVFACPELVRHDMTGWIIDLPLRADGRWAGLETQPIERAEHIRQADHLIFDGLTDVLGRLADRRDLAREAGAAARALMTRMYDPVAATDRLASIYDEALA